MSKQETVTILDSSENRIENDDEKFKSDETEVKIEERTKETLLRDNRKFNIDLAPKVSLHVSIVI